MIIIKRLLKAVAIFLVLALGMSVVSCDGPAAPAEEEEVHDTLIVGCGTISGELHPFYANSATDNDLWSMIGVNLLESDRGGGIVMSGASGDTLEFRGTDFNYTGIADCEIIKNADGTVSYEFRLRSGVTFSDGESLGVDDVLFSMYALSDPTYDGPNTFSTLPIVGMTEYRSGMSALADLISAAGEDNTDFTYWTKEQQDLYWQTLKTEAGCAFAQEIVDYCIAGGHAADVAGAIQSWGYPDQVEDGREYDVAEFFTILCEQYDYDYAAFAEKESAGTSLYDFAKQILCKEYPEFGIGVIKGEDIPNISGIERIGENALRVTMTHYDASAIYTLAMPVAPMHYYGDMSLYNEEQSIFGFRKGDLSTVNSVLNPMGAGPYCYVSYENGSVNFTANEAYYKGKPKIEKVSFKQSADGSAMVEAISTGALDICAPSLSGEVVEEIRSVNGNGDLSGSVITYSPVDYNGYGYIGMNANLVRVGEDSGSVASRNLRKAFSTLFAVYRKEAIETYYGDLAQVIEFPMSVTSWAAPIPGDPGYTEAFSTNLKAFPIYKDTMTTEQRHAAALETAKEYFMVAGYRWDDTSGKFTSAPNGAKLTYTIIIPGEGKGDHPCYEIASATAEALAQIGITLNIEDPADTDKLWIALNSGKAEMWSAAWSGTLDPDLYRVYYSGNCPTNTTGTGRNTFFLMDSSLDNKIMEARASEDITYRRNIYLQCLNTILDWGVEVPVYQRQEAYLFSTERLKIETLPEEMTTYCNWLSGIEQLEWK